MKNPVVTVLSLLRTVIKKVLGIDKKKPKPTPKLVPKKKLSSTDLKKKWWYWWKKKKKKDRRRRDRGKHGHKRHD